MRPILHVVIGFIVAILLAYLGCLLVGSLRGAPAAACTILYVVALIAWLCWAFLGTFRGRGVA